MTTASWIRRLFARTPRRAPEGSRKAPGARCRPPVEALEDRLTPATPVVTYYNASGVGVPVIGWQGIRGADAKGQYLISGTSRTHGLLFGGSIAATICGPGITVTANSSTGFCSMSASIVAAGCGSTLPSTIA